MRAYVHAIVYTDREGVNREMRRVNNINMVYIICRRMRVEIQKKNGVQCYVSLMLCRRTKTIYIYTPTDIKYIIYNTIPTSQSQYTANESKALPERQWFRMRILANVRSQRGGIQCNVHGVQKRYAH